MSHENETSICNGALSLIGADPIISLQDDSSERGDLCRQFYEPTRDKVLTAYPWNFAIARASLAQDTETPAYQYAYQYDLPQNPKFCLRVLRMSDPNAVWKVEGRQLLTNSATAFIKYIYKNEDPNTYSSLFRDTFEYLMASKLAYPIAGSRTLGEAQYKFYLLALEDAEDIDTQEGVDDPDDEYMAFDDLLDVRYR